ncbi:MAG: YhcH/YjgK/YiaL family protein [Mariprofundales bacterium]
MIIDNLSNCDLYKKLHQGVGGALNYLATENFEQLKAGKYAVDSDNVFAIVSDYETKLSSECLFEKHEKYIDIQYVAKGVEYLGYSPLTDQKIMRAYDEKDDYALYQGDGSFVKFEKGMIAILFPNDLHMPGTSVVKCHIKKVVVKVKYCANHHDGGK